jgi:hypothetical protein
VAQRKGFNKTRGGGNGTMGVAVGGGSTGANMATLHFGGQQFNFGGWQSPFLTGASMQQRCDMAIKAMLQLRERLHVGGFEKRIK